MNDLSAVFMLPTLANVLPSNDHAGFLRSEIDYYGVSTLLARILGLGHAPMSHASWLHAWIEKELWIPEVFVHAGRYLDPSAHRVLVARQDEADYMKQNGYTLARAVGTPFTYVPHQGLTRMADTLLIMPHHTPKGMGTGDQRQIEDDYLQSLQPFFNDFQFTALCVHADCLERGFWIEAAEKHRIPIIPGASLYDRNALLRMRTLFETFSHMTTNKISSHVAYGSLCGMKVSWFGSSPHRTKEDMKKHVFYEKHPGYADLHARLQENGFWESKYAWLRCTPPEALRHTDWAKEQLGWDNRIPVTELAKLLGWEQELLQHASTGGRAVRSLKKKNKQLVQELRAERKKVSSWAKDITRSSEKLKQSNRWRAGGWLLHPFSRKRRDSSGWLDKIASTAEAMQSGETNE